MGPEVTLYHVKRPDIKIDIVARFEDEKLVIDGYDIGKTVEEAWGDSDYEYAMTIPAEGVRTLYRLLGVEEGRKEKLLQALQERYHENNCFSAIRDFLDENGIKYDSFSWT